MATSHNHMLSTFAEWSYEHIRNVFEARSEREAIKALDEAFSERLEFVFNGAQLPRLALQKLVLTMLQNSGFCLEVKWLNAVGVPREGSLRDGMLGAYYIIKNVKKPLPGSQKLAHYERHKSVSVQIESESSDPSYDSRRIVKLAMIATDIPLSTQSAVL